MGQMEHLLNVYASKAAKHSIANFVGYAQVSEGHATKSLTEGLWLVSLLVSATISAILTSSVVAQVA